MPLAAFDFDHTIIDVNSDTYINKLITEKESSSNKHKYPAHIEGHKSWTQRMNGVFDYLHSNFSITEDDYRKCLSEIQVSESMKQLLRFLKQTGYHMAIVSDANTFFIETILNANNIKDLFENIFTNKASFDTNGRLVVTQFNETYNSGREPFKCSTNICAENICKGAVLQDIIKKNSISDHKMPNVYVGDGHNDYCPGLYLGPNDLFCVRENFSLYKLLRNEALKSKINCRIINWMNANEIISQLS